MIELSISEAFKGCCGKSFWGARAIAEHALWTCAPSSLTTHPTKIRGRDRGSVGARIHAIKGCCGKGLEVPEMTEHALWTCAPRL